MDSFLTSSLACITANLITHPLETLKTRQQILSSSASKSKRTLSIAKNLIHNEGVTALYKGLTASLIRAVVSGAGRLTINEHLKDQCTSLGWLDSSESNSTHNTSVVLDVAVRGGLAVTSGCAAAFLSSPIDMIRTRQAAASTTSPSIGQVFVSVLRKKGVHGLFAGSSALMGRAATFNFGQLLSYDYSKRAATSVLQLPSNHVSVHVLASLGAGIVAATISIPMENIKTVQQMGGIDTSFGHVTRHLYKTGGVLQFFRGWFPLYAKIGPHTLIVFVTAEFLRGQVGMEGFA